MAYISYTKLWESECDNIVSRKGKVLDMTVSQVKLEIHDTYGKDEKTTTSIVANNDEDVINKAYLDETFLKIDCHILLLEKNTTISKYLVTNSL